MVPRVLSRMAARIVLPLAVCLGGLPVAHVHAAMEEHQRGRLTTVSGVVTDMGNGKLQVQTQTGSVTVTLTNATRVFRLVTGSTADLKTGELITVTVAAGTHTVQQLVIAPSLRRSPHVRTGERPPAGRSGRGWTGRTPGQGWIMAINGNTITVAMGRGQTVTLTLNDASQILKIMRGALSDLDIGETVVVSRDSTGVAEEVEIVSS